MKTRPPIPDTASPWRRAFLMALACVPLLAACTTQAWYEGSRASARQQCNQQPPGAYEECMRRVNEGVGGKTYDDYQREREELRRQ